MKKKIISIVAIMSMIISALVPAFAASGDNTGDDIFGMDIYITISETEGTYNLGDVFAFTSTVYAGELYKQTAVRNINIDGPAAVAGFQFKSKDGVWTDVNSYNVEDVILNDVDRDFQVVFNEVGTYAINYSIESTDGVVYGSAKTKYVTITETSYSVSNEEPETTTPEPTTPESTTPEVVDPTTSVVEPSSEVDPTTPVVEPSSEVDPTTSGDEPSIDASTSEPTDDPTTVEPSDGETEMPTTVAPTEETTLDPALMKKPSKVTIKKAKKKLSAKKVSLKFMKVKEATGYEIVVYKNKKNAKKNVKAILTVDAAKVKVIVKSKILKNKKKLFVRVRAYADVNGTKVTGKWSKVKKIQIKK